MTKRVRLLILLVLVGIAAAFIWPTISWYFILPSDVKDVASSTRDKIRDIAEQRGIAVVDRLKSMAQADSNVAVPAEYNYVINLAKSEYASSGKKTPTVWNVTAVLSAYDRPEDLVSAIEDRERTSILAIKDQKAKIIQLGLDLQGGMSVVVQADASRLKAKNGKEPTAAEYSEAMDLSIEGLRTRVDAFGISEPAIRKDEGANRILIDIPGDNDPERVNQMLGGGSNLTLQLVDDDATAKLEQVESTWKQSNVGDWNPDDPSVVAQNLVPAGEKARAYMLKDKYGIDYVEKHIVTKESEDSLVDGTAITEAQVTRDNLTNAPNVNFILKKDGAEKMRALTKDNIGKSLAIVLDGNVRAYARIDSELYDQIRITGFSLDEANAISKVLKTGALPLDLKVESTQTVGASLGKDAIHAGLLAAAVGFALVVLFMIGYYLACGFIADIALLFNVYFMLAILSVFNLTLTLTSIAGLLLTVGMSVDANVLIFERMKEELRQGKSRAAAVSAGYKKAFLTIVDAHVTVLIASILLAYLGTGPVQGFAVTLTVGIVCSLFTALFVTHLIQDFETEQLKHSKMSIAWRLK